MEIYPAIDLRNGRAVRLTRGDYDKMDIYSDDPAAVAENFKRCGASNIHLVDLDGAKEGKLINFGTIEKIIRKTGLFAEAGGGIRDTERIEQYLDCGVSRVILGSAAAEDFSFVTTSVKKFGDKIAVGVDAKNGKAAIHGWKTITDIYSFEFCLRLRDSGVKTVIYTDISKDGALSGTNMEIYEKLSGIEGLNVIASGGITFYEELAELKQLNIYGAILGKALYTGHLDLAEVIERNGK